MTPNAYVREVESIIGSRIAPDEALWLFNSRRGGIEAERFASWVMNTRRNSSLPSDSANPSDGMTLPAGIPPLPSTGREGTFERLKP